VLRALTEDETMYSSFWISGLSNALRGTPWSAHVVRLAEFAKA